MSIADTHYSIAAPGLIRQIGEQPGVLSVTNLTPGVPIIVLVDGIDASETIRLADAGHSCDVDLAGCKGYKISPQDGATYPITVCILETVLNISLTAAPIIGNTSSNPVPVTVV